MSKIWRKYLAKQLSMKLWLVSIWKFMSLNKLWNNASEKRNLKLSFCKSIKIELLKEKKMRKMLLLKFLQEEVLMDQKDKLPKSLRVFLKMKWI